MAFDPGAQQNVYNLIVNVKWSALTFLVVTTKRAKNLHGNGVDSAPIIYVGGVYDWDAVYSSDVGVFGPYHIGWKGYVYKFPQSTQGAPKFKDLTKTLRWGGYPQPEIATLGPIGAQTNQPKPPVDPVEVFPPDFTSSGYTPGLEVRDLLVFNLGAIKGITAKDDFTATFTTMDIPEIPGGGGPTVTYKPMFFLWGTGAGFTDEINPFDFPVFGVSAPPGYPRYDGIHPNYTYYGAQLAAVSVVLAWALKKINTGIPGVTYPPWDKPFPPGTGGDGGEAIMQDMAAYCNSYFRDDRVSFYVASGIVVDTNPGFDQPDQQVEITFALYTSPPVAANAPKPTPEALVNYFPVDAQNVPKWDQTKAKTTIVRNKNGVAPMAGITWTVKVDKNKVLTVTP